MTTFCSHVATVAIVYTGYHSYCIRIVSSESELSKHPLVKFSLYFRPYGYGNISPCDLCLNRCERVV